MRHVLISAALPALALATGGPAVANPICNGSVCVESVQEGDIVRFFAFNTHPALPFTVDLNFEVENLYISQGNDDPFVLGGGQRVMAAMLAPVRPNAGWRWSYTFRWVRGDFTAVHDGTYLYRLPLPDGASYEVTQSCNGLFSHQDYAALAVDFGMPEGTPILAARDGVVVEVIESNSQGGPDLALLDFDNRILIQHADRTPRSMPTCASTAPWSRSASASRRAT